MLGEPLLEFVEHRLAVFLMKTLALVGTQRLGLGLNASARKLGFDNVSDDELTGSADAYGTAVADPDKFFVYYFARDCAGLEPLTGKYCRSVPEAVLPTCNPEDPDCDILTFSLREYIRSGTQRGPDAALTLSPHVIALQRP